MFLKAEPPHLVTSPGAPRAPSTGEPAALSGRERRTTSRDRSAALSRQDDQGVGRDGLVALTSTGLTSISAISGWSSAIWPMAWMIVANASLSTGGIATERAQQFLGLDEIGQLAASLSLRGATPSTTSPRASVRTAAHPEGDHRPEDRVALHADHELAVAGSPSARPAPPRARCRPAARAGGRSRRRPPGPPRSAPPVRPRSCGGYSAPMPFMTTLPPIRAAAATASASLFASAPCGTGMP